MIFQILLTSALIGVALYCISIRRRASLVGNISLVTCAVAMFFVWRPSDATRIANYCGIGRGADMIFYCWVVIGLLLTLGLHLRIRAQGEAITELVRQLALLKPQHPHADNPRNT